jgi:hypothetical protein
LRGGAARQQQGGDKDSESGHPLVRWINLQMPCGVAGSGTSRTPNSARASTMAFATAAGAGVVPPSPPALMPNGLVGESTSTISQRNDGRSAARGR